MVYLITLNYSLDLEFGYPKQNVTYRDFNPGSINFLGLCVDLYMSICFSGERVHNLLQILKGVCDPKKIEPQYYSFKMWVGS